MYQISLSNQSSQSVFFLGGNQVIPAGGDWRSDNLGDVTLVVPTRGPLDFHDIGDNHIPGDSKETWGVLIAFQGEEYVGRYEGGGQLKVIVNTYYQVVLAGMDLRQVYLPAFELG